MTGLLMYLSSILCCDCYIEFPLAEQRWRTYRLSLKIRSALCGCLIDLPLPHEGVVQSWASSLTTLARVMGAARRIRGFLSQVDLSPAVNHDGITKSAVSKWDALVSTHLVCLAHWVET